MDGVRLTLPPVLAAKVACEDVVIQEDENDVLYVYPASGGDELMFSWNDHGIIRDLYDAAQGKGPAVNAQAMARIGSWKAKEARGRDNQERAPEGAKYEDV